MQKSQVDTLWRRHENPVSVWWLILMYPIFVATIYRRSKPIGLGLIVSIALNLFVVSPPSTDEAWATRVVRGEQVWIEQGLRSSPANLLFTAAGGVVNLYTFRAAYQHQFLRTLLGTVVSMCLMLLFFNQMVKLYETNSP